MISADRRNIGEPHNGHGATNLSIEDFQGSGSTGLAGRGDVLLRDALNHASLIDGSRLSRAAVRIFAHTAPAALESALAGIGGARRRFIVVESVFSMEGDRAPLAEYAEIARSAVSRADAKCETQA